jgi:ribosomal protein L37E
MTTIALLTRHGKEAAVRSHLLQAGYVVHTVDEFDTDTLGTFTGEIARTGSQIDAAQIKARKATELSGSRFGLGSEGSFGPDPFVGLTAWSREVLVWWDAQEQRPVVAFTQGAATNYDQRTITTWEQAREFAIEAGFPSHGVVVGKPGQIGFSKDCADWQALEHQVGIGLNSGSLWLETDMRAHRNPTRMAMIAHCAQELSRLLQCPCPSCLRPGFGEISPMTGAVCESCGFVTAAVRAKKTTCNACGYSEEVVVQASVSAARCEHCNP